MTKPALGIMTIIDVAEYLKFAERTLYRLADAKKIPALNVGGKWRFSRADIDNWIKRQTMESHDTIRENEDMAKNAKPNEGEKQHCSD